MYLDTENSTPIDLLPNGSNIPVTNENKIKYVYLVANYRLNLQIAKQSRAFFSGLSTIIDTKWLRMFNQVFFFTNIFINLLYLFVYLSVYLFVFIKLNSMNFKSC